MTEDDVQMHHSVAQLRAMMPQASYLHNVGLIMTDMEAAAREGATRLAFKDGDYEVDDLQQWGGVERDVTTRAGRVANELVRLGYTCRYSYTRPDGGGRATNWMTISW